MKTGTIGLLAGFAIAIVLLRFGFWGMLLTALLAIAGYMTERWLWPARKELMAWLRSGKRQLQKDR
ncbi:DUF2273 domain-containing protein [Lacticaseibacillus mingshuiensis]|uniref:DUF2273 domain-containing protein n=1 Tax=Lacticaseibacillus mingshuiensis TaxID=2799574 RepID=A0ABW4CHW8_9LACO|nr:DUF2273 domain-containing protein [Lacticaseibacillus mingshuiensis]